jgi:hypothetical protein
MTASTVERVPEWQMSTAEWQASKTQREAAERERRKQIGALVQDICKSVLPKSLQQELAKLNAASRAADEAVANVQRELEAHRNNPPSDMANVREYAVRKIELEAALPIVQRKAADARAAKNAVLQRARELLQAEHARRVQALDAEIDRIRADAERAIEAAHAQYQVLAATEGHLTHYEGD